MLQSCIRHCQKAAGEKAEGYPDPSIEAITRDHEVDTENPKHLKFSRDTSLAEQLQHTKKSSSNSKNPEQRPKVTLTKPSVSLVRAGVRKRIARNSTAAMSGASGAVTSSMTSS